jgi:hypothetical protein
MCNSSVSLFMEATLRTENDKPDAQPGYGGCPAYSRLRFAGSPVIVTSMDSDRHRMIARWCGYRGAKACLPVLRVDGLNSLSPSLGE